MSAARNLLRPVEIKDPRAAMQYQLQWTLAGAVLLFTCITLMGIVWTLHWNHNSNAMEFTSEHFRKDRAGTLNLELAGLLKPLYVLARRFAYSLEFTDLNTLLTTPDFYSHHDRIDQLEKYFYPIVSRDTHLRSMDADGSNRVLSNFIGVVVALGLGGSTQPTSEKGACKQALFTSLILDDTEAASTGYLIDIQSRNATSGELSRCFHTLDQATASVGPFVTDLQVLPCRPSMASLWEGYQPEGFDNFTWYGPHNPHVGWGNHFEGSVPLYDAHRNQVGRFSAAISLGKSVGPLLESMIEQGGDLTRGGHGAVYTARGLVIGLSEDSASPEGQATDQVAQLADVVGTSLTGRALALVRERFGTDCPEEQHLITTDEVLVDVTPFRTESYGLAPLGERWCQLMTVPRRNVFAAIDSAAESGIAVGVVAALSFALAVAMLSRSLLLTYRAYLKMNEERKAYLRSRVRRADDSLDHLGAPMAVMESGAFLDLEWLPCFEDCRDSNRLTIIDTIKEIASFKAEGNLMAFLSHQWLGFESPDDEEGTQLKAMQRAVETIGQMEPCSRVHVWLDYISVPQRHKGIFRLAIGSLPTYVSLVNYFVICAPNATHRDTGAPCNLDTYSRRGWCRMEMLSKACSSGLQNMLICAGDGQELKTYGNDDFENVSLKVFEGDFTVREDMEALVEPVLGLYGLILRQRGVAHIDVIREEMERGKEAFFPKLYRPDPERPSQKVLFGPLVSVMEDHVNVGRLLRMSKSSAALVTHMMV